MKIFPVLPTTVLPELATMRLTQNQYEVVAKVVALSSDFEREDLIPLRELTIRWRIEMVAAFLAPLIDHARHAARDYNEDPEWMVESLIDVAVRRAREIDHQGHA